MVKNHLRLEKSPRTGEWLLDVDGGHVAVRSLEEARGLIGRELPAVPAQQPPRRSLDLRYAANGHSLYAEQAKIVDSLRQCFAAPGATCNGCPYWRSVVPEPVCAVLLMRDSADLIEAMFKLIDQPGEEETS